MEKSPAIERFAHKVAASPAHPWQSPESYRESLKAAIIEGANSFYNMGTVTELDASWFVAVACLRTLGFVDPYAAKIATLARLACGTAGPRPNCKGPAPETLEDDLYKARIGLRLVKAFANRLEPHQTAELIRICTAAGSEIGP